MFLDLYIELTVIPVSVTEMYKIIFLMKHVHLDCICKEFAHCALRDAFLQRGVCLRENYILDIGNFTLECIVAAG